MNNEFKWTNQLRKEFFELWDRNPNISPTTLLSDFIAYKNKPKEYEILRFMYGENEFTYIPNIKSKLQSGEYKISKVRRLSDGEIFSIGDDVLVYGKHLKIKRMFIDIEDRDSTKEEFTDDLILSSLSLNDLIKITIHDNRKNNLL